MRFTLVSDPKFPTIAAWWVIRVAKGDFATVMQCHKWLSTALFIKDGKDPHMQVARDREELDAVLRHPVALGAAFISTAMHMVTLGDFYVNQSGGMCPCDLTEHRAVEGNNWPGAINESRRITVSTWGNHFYLTTGHEAPITFLDKFNTEAEAVEFAKQFAPADRIEVKREARQFKEGD